MGDRKLFLLVVKASETNGFLDKPTDMERPLKAAILLFEENCWGLQAHKCKAF